MDTKSRTLFIENPKRGKSRHHPIPLCLSKLLENYMDRKLPVGTGTIMPIFQGRHPGKGLSEKQVRDRFEKWKRLSDIRQNLTLHSFRAGYATLLYKTSHGDLLLTARALGHTDLQTTERYLEKDPERLFSLIAKIFPL
ncbi:MAG: site-specific integrase [Proteobacteria bacterium]|nr:site-specific integrase [Pseudomonadota bacterium]